MPMQELPSDEDMLTLKKELNSLLWTKVSRAIPAGYVSRLTGATAPQSATPNIQCVAHAKITGALFYQQGFRVVERHGAAYVFDFVPGRNGTGGNLNEIGIHRWITVKGQHVDLSLYAESENPLIFRNRGVGGWWEVNFKDKTNSDWKTDMNSFLNLYVRRVFYVSGKKVPWSDNTLAGATAQVFPAAEEQGVALTYAKIITHCERLLSGSAASLTSMPQLDAWRTLA